LFSFGDRLRRVVCGGRAVHAARARLWRAPLRPGGSLVCRRAWHRRRHHAVMFPVAVLIKVA